MNVWGLRALSVVALVGGVWLLLGGTSGSPQWVMLFVLVMGFTSNLLGYFWTMVPPFRPPAWPRIVPVAFEVASLGTALAGVSLVVLDNGGSALMVILGTLASYAEGRFLAPYRRPGARRVLEVRRSA
jgi:hypothetical protein